MMRLLKTPEEILAESYSYISVLTIFIGVMFAYNLCAGLLRAIGNSLMPVLLCIFYILRHAAVLVPERRHFAAGKHLYGELLSQGISMGIMNAVVCSGTVILQRAINHLGAVYIACQATARKLRS